MTPDVRDAAGRDADTFAAALEAASYRGHEAERLLHEACDALSTSLANFGSGTLTLKPMPLCIERVGEPDRPVGERLGSLGLQGLHMRVDTLAGATIMAVGFGARTAPRLAPDRGPSACETALIRRVARKLSAELGVTGDDAEGRDEPKTGRMLVLSALLLCDTVPTGGLISFLTQAPERRASNRRDADRGEVAAEPGHAAWRQRLQGVLVQESASVEPVIPVTGKALQDVWSLAVGDVIALPEIEAAQISLTVRGRPVATLRLTGLPPDLRGEVLAVQLQTPDPSPFRSRTA